MRIKKICSLLLAVVMVWGMAACGSRQKDGPDLAEPTEESALPEKQTITITWAESDSTQVEVMNDYVKPALEKAFPEITFEYTGITTGKGKALETMSATGELKDIYCSDSGIYETLLAAGDFLDLAPYLEADGWLEKNYANLSLLYSNDTIYNVSCGQNDYYTPVIYYNEDLFRRLGLTEPETMDEFLEVCQRLLDNGIYPITINTSFAAQFLLDALISSYDPKALNDLHARNCEWTDERIVEALKVFDELKQMGAFAPNSATKGDADCLAEFAGGTAAMWPAMSWYNYDVAEDKVNFTTGTFNWPSGNAKYPTGYQQLTWGSVFGGWAINPNTENVEQCVEVLKVLLKAEAQRHADNGISENFIVENAAKPTNPVEIERMEDYGKASEYRTLLIMTGMDSATVTAYTTCLSRLVSDDEGYLSENFIRDFENIWKHNTKAAD